MARPRPVPTVVVVVVVVPARWPVGLVVLFGLFVAGVVEYALAAGWTQALVAGRVGAIGAITFVNVLLWGFVVANLRVGEPIAIVTHGLGCAVGAAATVWWTRRTAPEPAPDAG